MYGTTVSTHFPVQIIIRSSDYATGDATVSAWIDAPAVTYSNSGSITVEAETADEYRFRRALKKCDNPIWPWHHQRRQSPIRMAQRLPRRPVVSVPAFRRSTGQASAWRCRRAPWTP